MRSTSTYVVGIFCVGISCAGLLVACTDFAGPIPGTEPPPIETGGTGGSGVTGSGGTGTTSNGGTGTTSNGGSGNGGTDTTGNGGSTSGGPVSFDNDVHPILVDKCTPCHEMATAGQPGHGAADPDVSYAATQGMSSNEPVYDRILARAAGIGGFMPPEYIGCEELGTAGCLTQEEFDTIELWVEQGALR